MSKEHRSQLEGSLAGIKIKTIMDYRSLIKT